MAERARELGLSDDAWDEDHALHRVRSCKEYPVNFHMDPDHSMDSSNTPRTTPMGAEHRYVGDDEEEQGVSGQQ